jgi:hypothetical protein
VPAFVVVDPRPAAFIHIDCDLYSSTKAVLSGLSHRIVPGTVIVFDEYFNYPNWQQHEFRAFQGFCQEQVIRYDYIGFGVKDGHVAVVIREAGASGNSALKADDA